MNYLQKLFINSVVDIYSDILAVDIETGACSYIYTENHIMEEIHIPQNWDEAKYLLVESIVPEEREAVLEKLSKHMTVEAEADSAFAVEYHAIANLESRRNPMWRMNVLIIENRGKKQALIFIRDNSIDIKGKFKIVEIKDKDALTNVYNRFKFEELKEKEYQNMDTCGVLYFDINDFRKLVDAYGIETKEKVLSTLAESISRLENENVLAFRYDRDEFLVVAKNCTKEQFKDVIHSWMEIWVEFGDKRQISYTVSLGNAWDCAPVMLDELICRAKEHMCRNKRQIKKGLPMDYYLQEDKSTCFGLYNKEQFVKNATYRLNFEKGKYCIVAIGIEHFKLFNRWWGKKAGDLFLSEIAIRLKYYEKIHGGIAAYISGDDFALMLPRDKKVLEMLEKDLKKISSRKTRNVGFLPTIGVYKVPDDATDAIGMYDNAVEAQKHVIGNFDKRICVYNEKMTEEVEKEIDILNESRIALERRQFYLAVQPKCRITTGKIVGAEALVRWKHPERGMIFPGQFIPVLEKNGFISDLDLYVWEEACRHIRKWMDAGIKPVPISINVSRIDMLSMNVVKELNDLVKKYGIDKAYLKVEITESAYVDNANRILDILKELEEAGFTLLMDDFGSGYSSLNMLKETIVDILKIDMKFLDIREEDMQKGLTILKSIIDMSNEMNLPIIVEGVETKEQADFLTKMKVRYAQGYLFYRPMHIDDFEELIKDETNVDYRGIYNKKHDTFHLNQVMEDMIMQTKIDQFNKKIDFSKTPGGFIAYKANESQEIIAADMSIAHIFGCDSVEEFREYVGNSFIGMVHPEDRRRIEEEIWGQVNSTEWKMDYIKYRIIRKDGSVRYINDFGHLEEGEEQYFQVFILDVTDQI
ncbi:MAG: EAL domain-containing protein [Lachnospiraceae bacterium]|nr:EAL domain-containing protein [Lachnospiraceae bacterium]